MLKIREMSVNHAIEAQGLDAEARFSWKLDSDKRNVWQKNYQLRISMNPEMESCVWDSGIVECGESQNISAEGFEADFAQAYYAQVRAETRDGDRSDWSAPVRFTTGLRGMPWRAKFVTAEVPAYPEEAIGTYVRGSFTVNGEIESAWLFSTAMGIYVPWLNGNRVGKDLLAPGWTSYKKHFLYQSNEITHLLRQGENKIGAMLGAGWFKGFLGVLHEKCNYGTQTAFLCQIVIRYADGRVEWIGSDETWQGCLSPVTFAEIYDGEIYDARMEIHGWCEPDADMKGWHSVGIVEADMSVLVSQAAARVRCEQVLPAVRVFTTPRGERVVDFGQNLTGWPCFRLRGEVGKAVCLRCFETLDAEGNVYTENLRGAKTQLIYTPATTDEVEFHPEFTYYGFRYLFLQDWPEDVRQEDFSAWVIHSQMRETGFFKSSDARLNRLHENIRWSMRGNFLDVPTDCPQRDERMGWTGDAQIFCGTAAYLADIYAFFEKWLRDVKADQTPEGGVPSVVPDMFTGNPNVKNDWLLGQGTHSATGWADVAVIAPWTMYRMYGDIQILKDQYASMKGWVSFMERDAVDYAWGTPFQLGDWVALDAEPGSFFGATPNAYCCMAYFAYCARLMQDAAYALGKAEDAAHYRDLHAKILDKYRKTYLDENGRLTVMTQTAHILALHFNLLPEENRARNAEQLVQLIERRDRHLDTGFLGTPYALFALSESGCVDLAYDLLLKDDFPSWLYQVNMGATTIWEHWDGIRPDGTMWNPGMNSLNHYAYGSVGEWLYRGVAGINADIAESGFRHIYVKPLMDARLGAAAAKLETVYGMVEVAWTIHDEMTAVDIRVPENTRATIQLNNADIVTNADLEYTITDHMIIAVTGSGDYHIEYLRKE